MWTEWSEWTACSVTCGGGRRRKERECVRPDTGARVSDADCPGEPLVEEKCAEDRCPSLGPWSEWSPCPVTCGGGTKARERDCGLAPEGAVLRDGKRAFRAIDRSNDVQSFRRLEKMFSFTNVHFL